MDELLQRLNATPGCRTSPVTGGTLSVKAGLVIPEDLGCFYELCGGAVLFERGDYPVRIVSPQEFVQTNAVMLPSVDEAEWDQDISASWYAIADCGGGDYISIDLSQERSGRCYDSHHETHALAGDTPIIALSFRELLEKFLSGKGERWYWLEKSFASLGDAYD